MKDAYKDARERWDAAVGTSNEQRDRMLEDLRFSNPADPQQWDEKVARVRENDPGGARPTFVFDQTNQYISQVVNDSRMNKPQIQTVPASSGADEKVSEALDGIIRQIEYASSASIAYDTAQEHAARIGLGWFRIIPQVVDGEYNAQEVRILRVHDPLSIRYDPDFTMPDGSDQTFGFVETMIPRSQYERKYGKKRKGNSWEGSRSTDWADDDKVRITEYFQQIETKTNRIVCMGPDGGRVTFTEEDYWKDQAAAGEVLATYKNVAKTVRWSKLDGDDFLEETTDFPSKWVPLIPVMGYEVWIEGKRYLCGMVRRMMAGQRAYNMERNAGLEWMSKQPKAPYLVAWESVSEHQQEWGKANTSDPAYLPYDHVDGNDNPLPPPLRLAPPNPGTAYANLGQQGLADLQASIGMFNANLGKQGNETSGIAIKRREQQGDTANFHYIDNLARSMTHAGRIIVDMIPRLYDTERQARILGLDGKSQPVTIKPGMPKPYQMDGKKLVAISLDSGTYDVRCKVGPAYASLREEAADSLTKIVQTNPQLMTVLGPMWARMQDWPEADRVSKLLMALAPPQVQEIENSDEEISPAMMAKMSAMQQQAQQAMQQKDMQIQQLSEALTNAADQHDQAEQALKQKDMDQTGKVQAAQAEAQSKAQIEREKAAADAELAIHKASIDAETALRKAQIDAAARIVVARITAEANAASQAESADSMAGPRSSEGGGTGDQAGRPDVQLMGGTDTNALMADAFMALTQTLAVLTAPKPPMRIHHERDPNTMLLTDSYEVPMTESTTIQ